MKQRASTRRDDGSGCRRGGAEPVAVGQALGAVAPLFEKLDEKVVEQERTKLGA